MFASPPPPTDMTNSDSSSAWILTEFTHARMRVEGKRRAGSVERSPRSALWDESRCTQRRVLPFPPPRSAERLGFRPPSVIQGDVKSPSLLPLSLSPSFPHAHFLVDKALVVGSSPSPFPLERGDLNGRTHCARTALSFGSRNLPKRDADNNKIPKTLKFRSRRESYFLKARIGPSQRLTLVP